MISKKQLMKDLSDSVFDPRQPGRFSIYRDMTPEFIANTAVIWVKEGIANPSEFDVRLRDAISLLAYARSAVKNGA